MFEVLYYNFLNDDTLLFLVLRLLRKFKNEELTVDKFEEEVKNEIYKLYEIHKLLYETNIKLAN